MKALTIHQPFAHLIVTPVYELPTGTVRKRVENRRWITEYRGPILIHAGKSLAWFYPEDWPHVREVRKPRYRDLRYEDFPELAFGAVVGVANLTDCLDIRWIGRESEHAWVLDHHHASGPYCWVLEGAKRFAEPIPWRGQQGLFDVTSSDVDAAIAASGFQYQGTYQGEPT